LKPTTQRGADRVAARQANRRQTRALIEHASHDLPERQLALPIGAQGGNEAEFARQLIEHPDRPDRGTLFQLRLALASRRENASQVALMLERQPDRLHLLRLAIGEVGEGSMFDLSVLAIGLAQEMAGVGLAVDGGDRAVDEH
jgi:hypothetical protein